MPRYLLPILCLLISTISAAAAPIRVVTYNTENFFDCRHDSLKNDSAFLPEGNYHWLPSRYRKKIHNLSQVICNIGSTDSSYVCPAIIGLQEVENDSCLIALLRHLPHEHFPYKYIHYESADLRGIDVALLYDTILFSAVSAHPIPVPHDSIVRPTRDILYASLNSGRNTLHCFVCHLSSQLGGAARSEQRRQQVAKIIKHHTDSILSLDSAAHIIVMGDFNSRPQQNIPPLTNLLYKYPTEIGTHKYHGIWEILDQIYVSPALLRHVSQPVIYSPSWLIERDLKHLGVRPKRTFIGPRYVGGYSDHLPVYIDLRW